MVISICSLGWACTRTLSWQELYDWMQLNLSQDQIHILPVDPACMFPKSGRPSADFGQVLFQDLWFETQMQHIATFFKRPFTPQSVHRYEKLRQLCAQQFLHSCGRPLKHRLDLYQHYSLGNMELE